MSKEAEKREDFQSLPEKLCNDIPSNKNYRSCIGTRGKSRNNTEY